MVRKYPQACLYSARAGLSAAPANGGFGPVRVGRGAICRHGREFRQHLVNEGLDVTESIPRGRRGLGGSDGGAHMRLVRWLLRGPQT
jgi:hypothetical protein